VPVPAEEEERVGCERGDGGEEEEGVVVACSGVVGLDCEFQHAREAEEGKRGKKRGRYRWMI
jgi:hypothetical protein